MEQEVAVEFVAVFYFLLCSVHLRHYHHEDYPCNFAKLGRIRVFVLQRTTLKLQPEAGIGTHRNVTHETQHEGGESRTDYGLDLICRSRYWSEQLKLWEGDGNTIHIILYPYLQSPVPDPRWRPR